MNPERWPGEPLHERLTIEERHEIQACYMRQWLARKRRAQWELTRGKKAKVTRYDLQGRPASESVRPATTGVWCTNGPRRKAG